MYTLNILSIITYHPGCVCKSFAVVFGNGQRAGQSLALPGVNSTSLLFISLIKVKMSLAQLGPQMAVSMDRSLVSHRLCVKSMDRCQSTFPSAAG